SRAVRSGGEGGTATRAAILLVGLTVGLAGVGLARAPAAPDRTGRAAPQPDVRAVFLRDCAVCHGGDGSGTAQGPSLIDAGPGVVDFWVSTGRMPLPSAGAPAGRRQPTDSPAAIRPPLPSAASIPPRPGPPAPPPPP